MHMRKLRESGGEIKEKENKGAGMNVVER